MFRNPNYHTSRDRSETIDFDFVTNVTKAVIAVTMGLESMGMAMRPYISPAEWS